MATIFDTVNQHGAELDNLRKAVRRLDGGHNELAAVLDGLLERANVLSAELERLKRAAVEMPAERKRGGR